MTDIADPTLYAGWTVEQLDTHIAALKKLRAAKNGSTEFPSRERLAKAFDPDGDNFLGTGLTLAEFLMAVNIESLNASYYRQDRPERRRRLDYVIRLSKVLADIEARSIQATALARGTIEDVILGDWASVREMANSFRAEEVAFFGVQEPELQQLWEQFAQLLQEAFDTRPVVLPAVPVKH